MIPWTSQVLEHIPGPKFLDVKSGWVQTSNSLFSLWLVRLGSISTEVRAVIQAGPYRNLSSKLALVTLEQ